MEVIEVATKANQVVPISRGENPLDKLRQPFPPNQISKLPKESRKQIDERKNRVAGCMVWQCPDCGNSHHKDAVHLDYVGHAAATDRLLDTDPAWTWEPLAVNDKGLPAFDENGGLWIKLTVCGVTRLGYGSADGKSGGDAKKEIIGDAIRNAGMRFGMALDLWHKGDLHVDEDAEPEASSEPAKFITDAQRTELVALAQAKGIDGKRLCEEGGIRSLKQMPADMFERCKAWIMKQPVKAETPQGGSDMAEILSDEIPF